jgi:hypothetical protein
LIVAGIFQFYLATIHDIGSFLIGSADQISVAALWELNVNIVIKTGMNCLTIYTSSTNLLVAAMDSALVCKGEN